MQNMTRGKKKEGKRQIEKKKLQQYSCTINCINNYGQMQNVRPREDGNMFAKTKF
jgi:hypothetical protein